MKHKAHGVYIRLNTRAVRTPIYVGSVAGGRGRSFSTREKEHLRDLERGQHANDAMQRAHQATAGQGWVMIPVATVKRGDIAAARKIEAMIIKALGRACCNERR